MTSEHLSPRPSLARLIGPTTVSEFLAAGLVDYLHVIQIPIVLGRGVRLWDGLESLHSRYAVESATMPNGTTHFFFTKNT
jgi:riboflavin biosynthesis pyrimidine reductase